MIPRQSLSNRIVHWSVAISAFGLILTGIGQLSAYKLYIGSDTPSYAAQYNITFWAHCALAIVLIAAIAYHITVHFLRREFDILPRIGDFAASVMDIRAMIKGGEEPQSEKYLPEQRLSYALISLIFLVLIVTGLVKMWENMPGVTASDSVLFWSAQIHNFAAILLIFGIVAHLAFFAFKANRELLRAMLHGKVPAEYVLRRHSLWKEGSKAAKKPLPSERESETETAKSAEKN
ncbi:MAG: cytochrome b/b6 domain-containing protein [Helicobacteraceae bacterium]|jgi:formate dehydrogenase gamma subunit|nr:cytochrome b/b6 domain-containing protein [Helicobacteraceae bacterium]